MKIITVDCNYVEHHFAAAYLIVSQGRGFFVECNTNYAIPHLKQAVLDAGLVPSDIDGLCITHIHLDHAGGAGAFLREFKSATLYAHPKAARHAIDPSRLIASATQVYGPDFMHKLYGEILPCPPDRIVVLQDGDSIVWPQCGLEFETKHTLGHATHHVCLWEPESKTLFTGDSFGVSYPQINDKRSGVVAVVSTSPKDFDGEAALKTIDWVESLSPLVVAPTHYGLMPGSSVPMAAKQLRAQIKFSMELVKRIRADKLDEQSAAALLKEWTSNYFASAGTELSRDDLQVLELDFKVNAQGLVYRAQSSIHV